MSLPLPSGAELRPLDLPADKSVGPSARLREYADVRTATIVETTGRQDAVASADELLPMLYSTSDRVRRQWSVDLDGRIVGCCALDVYRDGEGDSARLTFSLLKRVWGRGIGSAVHEYLEAHARGLGVRQLLHWSEHAADTDMPMVPSPTGAGSVPDDRTSRFLVRRGYRLEMVERGSELLWDAATPNRIEHLHVDARRHAAAYRPVQWWNEPPPDRIDGYAWLKSRMSTDAPDAELGLPEEVWDAARVAEHARWYAQKRWSLLVTAAEDTATGRLCAYNELAIGPDHTASTKQADTLVLTEHRGHRLGMLVKTAGLSCWHERFPASDRVITWNSEDNSPMLAINQAIGFTPFGYEGAWRKRIAFRDSGRAPSIGGAAPD
ncbi:GNAT family N-acetyltransferase [Gordonia sp. (in: high G+C Gram-positive bacteria)]|uniref:GNAT family N-acetyltransferase n=1 Tax=Gordonia sp. (in: high G+C Gram-positive bacteria) TaxID=84139 RepID=UPI0039E5EC67